MVVEVGGKFYEVEQVTGDIYRAYRPGANEGVTFTAEYRNKGSYFKFRSAWKNNRTYSAWRYSYKYIPLMREATFEIAKHDGLYDYASGRFYRLAKRRPYLNYEWFPIMGYSNSVRW